MDEHFEFVGSLRCRTWHTWPAPEAFQPRNIFFYDGSVRLRARLAVLSYVSRVSPELYPDDEADRGPLLWDGKTPNLHRVRDVVLKTPSDVIPLEIKFRRPYRGEVDICIQFRLDAELTPGVVEVVRAVAFSTMALLNLQLNEHLVPTAPFQVARILSNGERQMDSTVHFAGAERAVLHGNEVLPVLDQFGKLLVDERYGNRMLVALELYAAHFAESQARVRFLLLVIAMEAVAVPTPKHQAALSLLEKWQDELQQQLKDNLPGSDAYESLIALEREMLHRKVDSIRSQVRNLFRDLGSSAEETKAIQKRALMVYDKRSKLVHDGTLPSDELSKLESEARLLLEMVFKKTIDGLGDQPE
jgi:hypothetical protein